MLQLSGSLLNRPILSLRTGGVIGNTQSAVINPNNLKIEGFYCHGSTTHSPLVLLYQDIRDIIPQGFVVNDADVLVEPEELVRLKEIMEIRFELLGKQVRTVSKDKLGKVVDFAAETTTMYIQKVYVSQSLFKNLTGGNLGIDRTQIVEITNKQIIVQDLQQHVPAHAGAIA